MAYSNFLLKSAVSTTSFQNFSCFYSRSLLRGELTCSLACNWWQEVRIIIRTGCCLDSLPKWATTQRKFKSIAAWSLEWSSLRTGCAVHVWRLTFRYRIYSTRRRKWNGILKSIGSLRKSKCSKASSMKTFCTTADENIAQPMTSIAFLITRGMWLIKARKVAKLLRKMTR